MSLAVLFTVIESGAFAIQAYLLTLVYQQRNRFRRMRVNGAMQLVNKRDLYTVWTRLMLALAFVAVGVAHIIVAIPDPRFATAIQGRIQGSTALVFMAASIAQAILSAYDIRIRRLVGRYVYPGGGAD